MAVYPLTWLAEVLRTAGCTVVEEDGWKTRGRDGSFSPKAIMLHHDASPPGETSNGVDVIRDGRPGLDGPLSQLWLAYDGTWHVVAAGRANHAGEGGPWGVIAHDQGNRDAIGIETDHTTDEKWTDGQRSEALRGVHALCKHLAITTRDEIDRAVTAHKEYAPTRKGDPDPMNMDNARDQLANYSGGGLLGMSNLKVCSNPNDQKFTGTGDFKTVEIDAEGGLTLLTGPRDLYVVDAAMTVEGSGASDSITSGDVVKARLQQVIDYPGDKATVVESSYPIHELVIGAGASYFNLSWTNKLSGDTGDGQRKLRLFILPPEGKTLKVTYATARIAY
jgi:N-acetylmuramoyl-L-alanine amidase